MDKTLGKEIPEEQRKNFLRDNCDSVEEKGYMKRYAPEEVQALERSLSGKAIAINDIEEEKKAAMAEFKLELDPLKEEFQETLKGIKEKAVFVKEACYKFVDREERMVGYYNQEGDLIEARPANPDELQGTIFQIGRKSGTN